MKVYLYIFWFNIFESYIYIIDPLFELILYMVWGRGCEHVCFYTF